MSDPWGTPWFNDPNAPQIPSWLYLGEKEAFAGDLIGAVSYGVVVALFFQCMAVLLSSTNPIGRVTRWALVVHTVALFLFLTIPIGIGLNYSFIERIDNREFPGDDEFPPGPNGYDDLLAFKATTVVSVAMFPLNQWLADGLLLHRCYVVYFMNRWVMAFPCLMYLASVATGIAYIYQNSGPRYYNVITSNIATSYFSICLSLNILLTLMIVIQLIVHTRNVRKITMASCGSIGLTSATATVATMLIESYALYVVTLLVYIVPWAVDSAVGDIFSGLVGSIQVIAPYLITLRVAKRRAMASELISWSAESIRFKGQGSTDIGETTTDGGPDYTTEVNDEACGELGIRDENAINEVPF